MSSARVLARILPGLLLASVSGASASEVTYVRDVAPILFAKCAECHRPGQIGPMSLLGYEETRPWAKSIAKVVEDRSMPPWLANPDHGQFRDSMALEPAQIETIRQWVAQGAPRGEGEVAANIPAFRDNAWRMGTPDQVFEMEKEFLIEDDVEDLYHTLVIPTGLTEDKWVVGTELLPGAAEAVHHILVFLAPPGADLSEFSEDEEGGEAGGRERLEADASGDGEGEPRRGRGDPGRRSRTDRGAGLFAKYGPGSNPEVWHEGRGRLLPAGWNFVLQMHYHKTPGPGTAVKDRSKLAVKYADGPVEHPITTAWIVDPSFVIPPGAPLVESQSVFRFIDDGHIYALTPHLHMRGKDFRYVAEFPDGSTEILLDVPRWDFNWQISYILQEPRAIPKGTKIRAIAHWDNSPENPNNPDPTKEVVWGGPSTAEMMIGFMDYTYVTKKKFQAQYGLPESGKNPFQEIGERRARWKREAEEQEKGEGSTESPEASGAGE